VCFSPGPEWLQPLRLWYIHRHAHTWTPTHTSTKRDKTLLYPAPTVEDIKRWCASDVCLTSDYLSVAYIWPKSKTERPKKSKIGTEVGVGHVTRDSDTTFKVKRSKVNLQGGILWRPPTQLVKYTTHKPVYTVSTKKLKVFCCKFKNRQQISVKFGK